MRKEVESDHWYTPVDVMERTVRFFDGFTTQQIVDPCTCDIAYNTLPRELKSRITPLGEDVDFLDYWDDRGFLFMNPPYSKEVGGAGKFTDHLIDLLPQAAVVVVNASTDTRWWHRLARESHAILFVEGRMKFDRIGFNLERVSGGSPRYANCIHLIGRQNHAGAFYRVFEDMGFIR